MYLYTYIQVHGTGIPLKGEKDHRNIDENDEAEGVETNER